MDEELIAAWQREPNLNLADVIEPMASSRVAAGIVEFSWRQRRQATFTPAYAPLLRNLMLRYEDSAKPFLDDLLGSTAPGQRALNLSKLEAEAVCRILVEMPDIRTWKKSALQILPYYCHVDAQPRIAGTTPPPQPKPVPASEGQVYRGSDTIELKTGERVEGAFKQATSEGAVIEIGGQSITICVGELACGDCRRSAAPSTPDG